MAYYNNEYDTGIIVDEKTGDRTAMYTISITLAEYRELVAKAASNESVRLSNDYWRSRKENDQLRYELADLQKKLAGVKEAAE